MRFWPKKKVADVAEEITDDLKKVTEIAGDQIAPGAGKWFLIVGGLAAGAAATYFIAQRRKRKNPNAPA